MGALSPENPGGAFKSLWGRFFGVLGDDMSYRHLWVGGPYGKVVASTRNDMFTVFTGSNGAGACTLAGARVGDIVVGVINETTPGDAAANFESVITVADQIQQSSASDLSAAKFNVLIKRQS